MIRDTINELTIILAACHSAAQENPKNAIVNIDEKPQQALQEAIQVLELVDKAEMPEKRKNPDRPIDYGFNQALDKVRPYMAKLELEIKQLKQGICEHVKANVFDGDCKLCEFALAAKGYPIWVKKARKLQKEIAELKKPQIVGLRYRKDDVVTKIKKEKTK